MIERYCGPDVVALPILGGRIVDGEEHPQQVGVGQLAGVEFDLNHLGVTRAPAADRLIGRVRHMAAGVAGHHRAYAAKILEHRFQAPEAAAAQGGGFLCRTHGCVSSR